MSRPLRLEYPGAWYHVMNRGRRHENIFADDDDYSLFLEVLNETARMWSLNISAYCLMPNHYHLLVHTPQGNLSRCMRHLNGIYTQRYNRGHGVDGPLFRGRYKAVLVEEDQYLLELLRYIHRNPVSAGMVKELADYKWSSHRGYGCEKRGWQWLYRDPLLKMFSAIRSTAFNDYAAFIEQPLSTEIQHVFSLKKLPPVLGSTGFVEKVKERFACLRHDKEFSDRGVLSVDGNSVIDTVCAVCLIGQEQLLKIRRGVANVPRDLAIYVLRAHSSMTLSEIGSLFGIESYSTVSTAICRFQKVMKQDATAQKMYKKVCRRLGVGQPKT